MCIKFYCSLGKVKLENNSSVFFAWLLVLIHFCKAIYAKINILFNTATNGHTPPYNNRWKAFHDSLADGIAKKYKTEIEKVLGVSQSEFCRKIKEPNKFLSIAEKQAIARVYQLKEGYVFPELNNHNKERAGQ